MLSELVMVDFQTRFDIWHLMNFICYGREINIIRAHWLDGNIIRSNGLVASGLSRILIHEIETETMFKGIPWTHPQKAVK